MKFLADLLKSVAEKIDSPEITFDAPVRLPRSPQGMMDHLIDATYNGVGDATSATTGTVLMNLARKTGHPRWAIMSAIYEAIGFDESDKHFPSHKEILKAAKTKHMRIGVDRGPSIEDVKDRVPNLADELNQIRTPIAKEVFGEQTMERLMKIKRPRSMELDFGLSLR